MVKITSSRADKRTDERSQRLSAILDNANETLAMAEKLLKEIAQSKKENGNGVLP